MAKLIWCMVPLCRLSMHPPERNAKIPVHFSRPFCVFVLQHWVVLLTNLWNFSASHWCPHWHFYQAANNNTELEITIVTKYMKGKHVLVESVYHEICDCQDRMKSRYSDKRAKIGSRPTGTGFTWWVLCIYQPHTLSLLLVVKLWSCVLGFFPPIGHTSVNIQIMIKIKFFWGLPERKCLEPLPGGTMLREQSRSWKTITYADVSIHLTDLDVCSQLSLLTWLTGC